MIYVNRLYTEPETERPWYTRRCVEERCRQATRPMRHRWMMKWQTTAQRHVVSDR